MALLHSAHSVQAPHGSVHQVWCNGKTPLSPPGGIQRQAWRASPSDGGHDEVSVIALNNGGTVRSNIPRVHIGRYSLGAKNGGDWLTRGS